MLVYGGSVAICAVLTTRHGMTAPTKGVPELVIVNIGNISQRNMDRNVSAILLRSALSAS